MFGAVLTKFRTKALKVEPGVSYTTRNGKTTEIVAYDSDDFRSFYGYGYRDSHGRMYNAAGRMYHEQRFSDPTKESAFDIVDINV